MVKPISNYVFDFQYATAHYKLIHMLLQLAHLPAYIGGTLNSFRIRHTGERGTPRYKCLNPLAETSIIVCTLCRDLGHV